MATIKDVSELAKVSQATVSRVLNGTTRVDDDKKQRVFDAVEKLGYRPNAHAKSLASNCSNSVGMVVSELSGPYFGEMMAGAEDVLRKNNKQILIASSHANEAQEKEAIEYLLSCRCDALILHAETLTDEYIIELSKRNIFVVLLNRHIEELSNRSFILDNALGGFLATEHLINNGHKKIANILGPQWKHDARERFDGYLTALKKYGLPFDPELIVEGNFQESGGVDGVNKLIQREKPFTGLVCGNDEMAFGAIGACRSHHFQVPEDIAVVGFDNISFARYISPKLTTVHFPIRDIAADAARLVIKHVYQKQSDAKFDLTIAPELIVRESSITP